MALNDLEKAPTFFWQEFANSEESGSLWLGCLDLDYSRDVYIPSLAA